MTSQSEQDFDETLKGIAKELHLTTEIDDLGKALGCTIAEIGRCHDANEKQGGNYMGTLNMLRTWRKKQTAATELQALRAALIKAQQNQLASKYCANSGEGRQHTSSSASSASTDASNTETVSDEKLEILATNVPSGKYTSLSFKLGTGYNEATSILDKHKNDSKKAIRECMNDWKNRTGGSLDDLKNILRKAELRDLVRYIE